MTIADLQRDLAIALARGEVAPDSPVVLSQDAEGNGFRTLAAVEPARVRLPDANRAWDDVEILPPPDRPWDDDVDGPPCDGEPAFLLWPS